MLRHHSPPTSNKHYLSSLAHFPPCTHFLSLSCSVGGLFYNSLSWEEKTTEQENSRQCIGNTERFDLLSVLKLEPLFSTVLHKTYTVSDTAFASLEEKK